MKSEQTTFLFRCNVALNSAANTKDTKDMLLKRRAENFFKEKAFSLQIHLINFGSKKIVSIFIVTIFSKSLRTKMIQRQN